MHGASHEVLGRLAVGGMAELYLARTTHDDGSRELVVLKRILPHLSEDPEFVRMFRDEAYLAATLDHPNIVHVHDIGQDGEDYFFTMEYVHGENVRTIIKAAQKLEVELPLEHVIQIALGVCQGLHYAHEQVDEKGEPLHIVHRDVSPTNILVSFDGEVKIVDFGIAKAAAATHVTQAGMLKGKASYMSPEQCRAEGVDRRSDVFAIGILVYEMTTLTRLFRGENELAILHQILTGAVEAPSTRVDDYHPGLERIVMRALAQRPADRYPDALAMHDDLVELAADLGLNPSRDGLGELIRDLCGERPAPWDDEDEDEDEDGLDDGLDDGLELDGAEQSNTGMPTSMGNFEDDEDTQVNRPAPDLRTLVPGAPGGWSPEQPELEEATGTTNRRVAPQLQGAEAPPRPGTSRVGAKPVALPARPAAAREGLSRFRMPSRPPLRRPASTDETVPVPGADDDLPAAEGPGQSEATTPMAKPSAARTPTPRGPAARGSAPRATPVVAQSGRTNVPLGENGPDAPKPFNARSGRTLAGAGGGLAGPLPARSGRTLPGSPQSPFVPTSRAESGKQMVVSPGQSPLPGSGKDRTMAAGAGSRPLAANDPSRPGRRPSGIAANVEASPSGSAATSRPSQPSPPPSTADRTMALTPEQALAMRSVGASASPPAPASQWSGAGVDRTQIAPPREAAQSGAQQVDEGARTIAVPRFDRTMMAEATAGRELPRGPMGWDGRDPLTQTQRTTPSTASSLTSTQRSPVSAYGVPQRIPSGGYPELPNPPSNPSGSDGELRRPEMRSPSPRAPSTPRSLWVPVLIVVIVGLAGTAAWLWLSSTH